MTDIFRNKKPNYKKLVDYGFKKKNNIYSYENEIYNGQFLLKVEVEGKDVTTKLTDSATGDLYTLHLIEGAEGTFVGKIREEYEKMLYDISVKCFETDIFEFKQTLQIIDYVRKKYETEPEYLWEKFPRNAVCRRKDNKKWYFAILSVKGSILGLETNNIIEVIDLRVNKENIADILKSDNIYPAYHMNKKNWVTIILDGSMNIENLCKYIDESYILAKK